jgi:hypothetical protein
MEQTQMPAYVLDFRNTHNCAVIESTKPGQEVSVLVRSENNPDAVSIKARGIRSQDGLSFTVSVNTDDGCDSHDWTWIFLLDAIEAHRGK